MKINSELNGSQAFAVKQITIPTMLTEGVGYSSNDLSYLDYFTVLCGLCIVKIRVLFWSVFRGT